MVDILRVCGNKKCIGKYEHAQRLNMYRIFVVLLFFASVSPSVLMWLFPESLIKFSSIHQTRSALVVSIILSLFFLLSIKLAHVSVRVSVCVRVCLCLSVCVSVCVYVCVRVIACL